MSRTIQYHRQQTTRLKLSLTLRIDLFLIVLFQCLETSAQQHRIEGHLLDKHSKEVIRGVSVNLKSSEGKIIAFKITDDKGYFQLSTSRSIENTLLEVNHISYSRFSIPLPSNLKNIRIELEQSVTQIEEVSVKSRPKIRQQGDTLAYNVEGFAKEEDRSVGDVLKRMPGIEVTDDGQIKYQGKAISNFYIDGDDLLDDKYTIGSRTIPHNMVRDVQVMNNHEHLKVLKGKRFTDNVALNLVIKDDAKLKLTGQAKLGGGLPSLYDGEVNSLLFNKKYKSLNALFSNNIGNDLAGDFRGFNSETILSKMGTSSINNLLSLGVVGGPPLSKVYYYRNKSTAVHLNNMVSTKNAWQIKSNVQVLYDANNNKFNGFSEYLTEEETISFDETQSSHFNEWLVAIRLNAEKNVAKKFIKNVLSLEYEKENGYSDLWSNTNYVFNERKHAVKGIANTFEYIPTLANGDILQINWFGSYANKPQHLISSTDAFTHIFNGLSFDHIMQQVEVPNFFTRASIEYRLPKGQVMQSYTMGTSLEQQQLISDILLIDQNISSVPERDSTVNDMNWLRTSFFIQANYEWRKKQFSSALSLPISVQRTAYEDHNYHVDEKRADLIFNPSFQARYAIGHSDEVSFSYQRSNGFGNIENVYRGLILKNYRTLSNNSSGINESRGNNFSLSYKLGNVLKMTFFNFNLGYNQSISSTIVSNFISNETTQTQLIAKENKMNIYNASIGYDKFLFAWACALKIKAGWSRTDYNQLFNQEILPFVNTSYVLSPSMELKIFKTLNASYTSRLNWTNTTQQGGIGDLDRNTIFISQEVGLPANLFKSVHVNVKARHLFSHQPGFQNMSYVFFDTFARYRSKKWRTDFELNLTNLANIRTFETYAISANNQSHNVYELRGRMAVLKVVFGIR
ncbi:hypothetical protein FAZ19_03740 [Sphingobacterium alkalisoli]|uniref:TonB-dependent receptor n=1 Tax=Sphingobacterium alkalisoli TaxID=1874115 RepID=A0A4U0H924_9SPHI|nr:hypothetical protein [Sphingobacterium alkalisoli]TJY68377.1 hypothetical protein FAZ19_03740 [Sphingobacterium alkalisoli]GGH06907.1 hypothetical protein GCM10011418_03840 [Sphingobacterium alkalisoli]